MSLYKNIITNLGKSDRLKRMVPVKLRSFFRKHSNLYAYNLSNWKKRNPYIGTSRETEFTGNTELKVGIIYDFSHRHVNYMKACEELGISYVVVDLFLNNWIDRVKDLKDIDHYFVWPSTYSNVWKNLLDERLMHLEHNFQKKVFPEYLSTWLYESKRRLRDWFYLNEIKIPETYVFYNIDEAKEFVNSTPYPVVFKSDIGAGATGVRIIKSKSEAEKLVDKLFFETFVPDRLDSRESQWGYIMFQQYIADVEEWRVARIGDSFFVRLKEKVGEFHSGSGNIEWAKPRTEILDLAKHVTDIGNFKSMGVDIFESPNGELFVNEIHTVFGVKDLSDDEDEGKWVFEMNEWKFYKGSFSKYQFAKERIEYWLTINNK